MRACAPNDGYCKPAPSSQLHSLHDMARHHNKLKGYQVIKIVQRTSAGRLCCRTSGPRPKRPAAVGPYSGGSRHTCPPPNSRQPLWHLRSTCVPPVQVLYQQVHGNQVRTAEWSATCVFSWPSAGSCQRQTAVRHVAQDLAPGSRLLYPGTVPNAM